MTIDWSGAGLRTSSVSAEVAAYLQHLISSGQVQAGEKLPPEREIADKLEVSRTSVRQAMLELTLKGLTERKPGRGTVVLQPNPGVGTLLGSLTKTDRHLLHTVDLRQVIEPSVAERAAERATPADVARLTELVEGSAVDLSPAESAQLDQQFHEAVAHATQNPLLIALIDLMRDWLSVVREESHSTAEGRVASMQGHQRILAAIRAGDSPAALNAMREHVDEIGRLVRDRLEAK